MLYGGIWNVRSRVLREGMADDNDSAARMSAFKQAFGAADWSYWEEFHAWDPPLKEGADLI